MNEKDRLEYEAANFKELVYAFGLMAEGLSIKEVNLRMNLGEFQDPVNFRKFDFGHDAGEELRDEVRRAMDEFDVNGKIRIATYMLFRIGTVSEHPVPKNPNMRDGWEETREYFESVLVSEVQN